MDFYDRFEKLCANYRPEPISPSGLKLEKMMQAQGVKTFNRTTVRKWKENHNIPRGDILMALANIFNTTTDYLLGRTDDITDHSKDAPALTDNEKRLVQAFLALDDARQKEVLRFVEFIYCQGKKSE